MIGTLGIGIIAQFNNITGLIFAIIPVGALGFSRYIAEFKESQDFSKIFGLFKIMTFYNIPIAFIISILIILLSKEINVLVFNKEINLIYIFLFSLSIPFGTLSSIFDIYIKSLRLVKEYAKYISYSSLISLILVVPILFIYGILGAVLSLTVTFLVNIIVGIFIVKKNLVFPKIFNKQKIDKDIIYNIYKIGSTSVLMLVLQQLSFLFIRTTISNKLSMEQVGIFQSAFSISNGYFGLFFTIIAAYSIPKLSAIKDINMIINEINQTLKLVLLIYFPLLATCFVFRNLLIVLLYSKSFMEASDLLFFQLQGDFLKSLGWVLGLWLLPMLRLKEWLLFDVIYYVNLVGIFYYLLTVQNMGIKSVSLAYYLSFLIHFILNLIYIRRKLNFKFMDRNLKLLLSSLFCLVVLFVITEYSQLFGYILFPLLISAWFVLNISKNDFLKLKLLFLKANKTNGY